MASFYDESIREIKQEYDLNDLTTPIQQAETREIEQGQRNEIQISSPSKQVSTIPRFLANCVLSFHEPILWIN